MATRDSHNEALDVEKKDSHDSAFVPPNEKAKDGQEAEQTEDLPWYKQRKQSSAQQDPFGDEEGADVQYRTMRWWQASMIMIAETVSLGILSLPSVLSTIGMVPGIILILGLGLLATYSGYVIGQFKLRYPHVHSMAEAGEILAGAWGREIFGTAQVIFYIFSMGSHVLTFTIAMNNITDHATCTIVWGIIALVIFWLFTLPRTLKKVSYFSIVSFISIIGSVMITMIALGVDPAPNLSVKATAVVSFADAFLSVTNIIFAFAGHVAFFSFISELRDPKDFAKGLYLLQAVDISLYLIVAIVVYRYAGDEVKSPALGSTGPTVRRIAYGIALPTVVIAGVIYGHVASKYIYVRMFRGTKHMSKNTVLAVGSWAAITLTLWVIAFIIAESIPTFNNLLALISSLFASWFTYGISGIFWLYMNPERRWFQRRNPRDLGLSFLNWFLVLMGAGIMGMGLYASGKAIHDGGGNGSWTCADNSMGA